MWLITHLLLCLQWKQRLHGRMEARWGFSEWFHPNNPLHEPNVPGSLCFSLHAFVLLSRSFKTNFTIDHPYCLRSKKTMPRLSQSQWLERGARSVPPALAGILFVFSTIAVLLIGQPPIPSIAALIMAFTTACCEMSCPTTATNSRLLSLRVIVKPLRVR